IVSYPAEQADVPVDSKLLPAATVDPGGITLTWPTRKTAAGTPFYTVFRGLADGSGGVRCAARRCTLTLQPVGTSDGSSYLDPTSSLPSLNAKWTYRIGVSANANRDPTKGGLVLLSLPLDVAGP